MNDDLNRQMGEVSVTVEYMKEQIDKILVQMQKQQSDLDAIKMKMAEIQGAKKFSEWMRAVIAGIVGAVASIVSIFSFFKGLL